MMKLIESDLLNSLARSAEESPRQRSHHNIHENLSDTVQKLVVAATARSYFRPHRHIDKSEFALVLRGRFAVFLYNDKGDITHIQIIGNNTDITGLEIPANTWHNWLALDEENIFFETKQGPYDPATATEFAPWSPAENSADVEEFMQKLRKSV